MSVLRSRAAGGEPADGEVVRGVSGALHASHVVIEIGQLGGLDGLHKLVRIARHGHRHVTQGHIRLQRAATGFTDEAAGNNDLFNFFILVGLRGFRCGFLGYGLAQAEKSGCGHRQDK